MGYFVFGQALFTIGLLFRLYWAIAGNEHAKELFFPPLLSKNFWCGVWHEIRWCAFLAKEPNKYLGHNPLAMLFMHFMFV